jgi:adenylosuccinate lyase
MEVAVRMREEGAANDLIERIAADSLFAAVRPRLPELLNPDRFVGRAPEQVEEFLAEVVDPLLRERQHLVAEVTDEVRV